MVTYSTEGLESFDPGKEQRRMRLGWVFYGVGAMLFVVCGFYMQTRVEQRVLHAYALTVLAHSGFMFLGILWPVFVAEMVIFSFIIDHFKASAAPDQPPRKLKRFLTWTKNPKREAGRVITIPGEGSDSDPAKEARKNYLKWAFFGMSAFLLVTHLLRGVVISGTGLYVIKASLLTMLCYGHLLYVEEKDELRSKWLWATVLVTLPFHVALFGIIIAIDRMAPYLAANPVVFLFIIWAVGWIEARLMDQIVDDYRPWGPVSESVE
jgi:hypothetical protein